MSYTRVICFALIFAKNIGTKDFDFLILARKILQAVQTLSLAIWFKSLIS